MIQIVSFLNDDDGDDDGVLVPARIHAHVKASGQSNTESLMASRWMNEGKMKEQRESVRRVPSGMMMMTSSRLTSHSFHSNEMRLKPPLDNKGRERERVPAHKITEYGRCYF